MKSCSSVASTSSSGDSTDTADQADKEDTLCSLNCLANCLSLPSERFDLILLNRDVIDFTELCSVSNDCQPFLSPSSFKNIPPTILFYTKSIKVKKPPSRFVSRLTWCSNSLLALVVRHSLVASHFKLVDETKVWIGYWGRHLKSIQYRTLKPFQKVNHFPGAFHLGRKDRLWLHLHDMMERFHDEEFCIMPFTYILPRDMKKLRAYLSVQLQTVRHVILKPPASARGTGISIVSRFNMVPPKTPLVAQHYIESPFLINGSKFDLRLYIYVTSYDPLRIYIYEEGLVRFASVPYSPALSSYSNQYMHLTNYSINKLAQQNGTIDGPVPKWTLTEFWNYLDHHGHNSTLLKEEVNKVALKAIVACESHVRAHAAHYSKYPFISHELYGMDVLVDSNLQPWLIEMNISPSLHSSTPLDAEVKAPLASHTLSMAGIPFPICFESDDFHSSLYYRTRNLQTHKTQEHLKKEQEHLEHFIQNAKIRPDILKELTDADVRILVEFEDEFARRSSFQLIYPAPNDSLKYLHCMRAPLYSNLLLAHWQQITSEEKTEKRKIIEEFCEAKKHIVDLAESEEDADTQKKAADEVEANNQ